MKTQFDYSNSDFFIDLNPSGSGKSYRATIRDEAFDVEILEAKDGRLELLVDGKRGRGAGNGHGFSLYQTPKVFAKPPRSVMRGQTLRVSSIKKNTPT